MLVYVDSTVAVAVAFREPGWQRLADRYRRLREQGRIVVASKLLRTEVRRVFYRLRESFDGADASVEWINLIEVDADAVGRAGDLRVHVKTLDAIHLAVALSLDEKDQPLELWTLDGQMRRAATALGLTLADDA